MPKTYDVIIIGGSHAGISAALTLYRAFHTCLIFDSGKPRDAASDKVRLTNGWEGQDPQAFRATSVADLEKSGLVDFVSHKATTISKNSDGNFEVVDVAESKWTGRRVLLAMGVEEKYPDIDGYAENYGSLIYHCMFCFGNDKKGSSVAGLLAMGILAHPQHTIINARDALKFVDSVTLYTNGDSQVEKALSGVIEDRLSIDSRRIKSLAKSYDGTGIVIEFDTGEKQSLAFLVHKPDIEVSGAIPEQLGCEMIPDIGIKVTPPFNSTSVEGVFAAGDCCSPLRNIPSAMSMGSFAGCGIARSLPPGPLKK
ncbi:thioredoxin reductase [Xylaria grammica]|nr:thioredoxin reductase [Xylaria grammica]